MMAASTGNQNDAAKASRSTATDFVALRLLNDQPCVQRGVPVTSGVCFPRGVVSDARRLTVVDPDGSHVLTQADVTAAWPDGSVKWAFLTFVAPEVPSGVSEWLIRNNGHPGSADATDDSNRNRLFGEADAFVLTFSGETVPLTDVRTEVEAGRVRSASVLHGVYADCGLRLNAVWTSWKDSPRTRLDVTLHNPAAARHPGGLWDLGDDGSVLFEAFEVVLNPARALSGRSGSDLADRPADRVSLSVEGEDDQWCGTALSVFQASSGGEHWDSANHWNRDAENPCPFNGYRVRTASGEICGLRANPIAGMQFDGLTVRASVSEFWQTFPKSMAVSPQELRLGLFPAEWPEHELQGGEQKTHTVWFCAESADSDTAVRPDASVRVSLPPTWFDQCGVFGWFGTESADHDRLDAFVKEALGPGRSWPERREIADQYGWRNFGDVHADHEQTHYQGTGTVVSHYNNQFDMLYGALLQFARTGDCEWFEFSDALARHVAEIDVYHTSEDRNAFNGGLFWHTDHYVSAATATHRAYSRANAAGRSDYGGGVANEHNYTTGLLHHYYLTGNQRSRRAVRSLADWVLALDDGSQTVFSLLDSGPTGLASATKSPDFHGPGRGSGNSLNALIDGWLLTSERKYLDHAEALVRRVVHPQQDLDALQLSDSENRWSYTVFLTALARYLELKIEMDELNHPYAYGRAVMQRYGDWMAEHERTALSDPDKVEFVTEAWPTQDIRKANVLRLCARFEDNRERAETMRRRADEIADQAWSELLSFDTRNNARSLSILMTEGLRDGWHRGNPMPVAPVPRWAGDFGLHQNFFSQKDRVRQGFRRPAAWPGMLAHALQPTRWLPWLRALKRQLWNRR